VGYRTRRALMGATFIVLAIALAGTFGAAKSAAATGKATTVHKISACGYTATAPGTYELTQNVTDSGNGSCITLNGDNITLYLDGHTITGSGSDNCVYVEGGSTALNVNESVIGGTMAMPAMRATLTSCNVGVYVYWTSNTSLSSLTINSPDDEAVYAYYAAGMTASHIRIALNAGSAYGFYLEYGADNTVTQSTVKNNGSAAAVYAEYETGDMFCWNIIKDPWSASGSSGYGFEDKYSSRNTYMHNNVKGQYYAFYLDPDGYGPVKVIHNYAQGAPGNSDSYGYYIYGGYQESDYASRYHTIVVDNQADGFQYGFYDESGSEYAVAETWFGNTATNYSEYGFYIYYPTNYVMIGNLADGNTATHKYDGSSTTYGFYLYYPYSYYPFAAFDFNESYDNQYGFYSDEYMVGGKGNIAKRNKYNSYDVEITG
jgi:hypothetical protein